MFFKFNWIHTAILAILWQMGAAAMAATKAAQPHVTPDCVCVYKRQTVPMMTQTVLSLKPGA